MVHQEVLDILHPAFWAHLWEMRENAWQRALFFDIGAHKGSLTHASGSLSPRNVAKNSRTESALNLVVMVTDLSSQRSDAEHEIISLGACLGLFIAGEALANYNGERALGVEGNRCFSVRGRRNARSPSRALGEACTFGTRSPSGLCLSPAVREMITRS